MVDKEHLVTILGNVPETHPLYEICRKVCRVKASCSDEARVSHFGPLLGRDDHQQPCSSPVNRTQPEFIGR